MCKCDIGQGEQDHDGKKNLNAHEFINKMYKIVKKY